ncbi:MAG: hypothetical protein LHV69_04620 [Elusimicrobia bacterium]|nr:hypothetical protein [Candidatus Obscuribacterium magneticum]
MKRLSPYKHYVVCVNNEGYEVSLEKRKIYAVVSDRVAEERGLIRIKDESRQSYLYPSACFIAIQLPQPVLRALAA